MADFAEELCVSQIDAFTYEGMWVKIDLATEELVDYDWELNCPEEDIYDLIERHNFDTDRVFNHFMNYPYSGIRIREEY